MKTKLLMVKGLLLFISMAIMVSCQDDSDIHLIPDEKPKPLEPYMLAFIDAIEPFESEYFVRMKFVHTELNYSVEDTNISLITTSAGGYGNMKGKGYAFRNKLTEETISIMFYAHRTFNFKTANYRYGNPWKSLSGANIEFYTPAYEPHSFFLYMGSNQADSYFRITWLDKDKIYGEFKTRLYECCGGPLTYWVEGEFVIPRVYF